MAASVVQWLTFFFAAVLVVVGTSLFWAGESAALRSPTDRAYRFTIFEFWLVTLSSLGALLAANVGWFPLKNTGVWIAVAAGTFFILVSSRDDADMSQNGSIALANYYRILNANSATQTSDTKRVVGGAVLAYIGVFLAFLAGLPWSKPTFSGTRFLLVVFQFVLLIIGVVVIWHTDATVVSSSNKYQLVIDDGFYTILIFFFTLLGVTLSINDLIVATSFFAAYNYCRVFTSMFMVASSFPSQEDDVYAGYVILTFSNLFAVIVALLGDSGKSSKVGSNN